MKWSEDSFISDTWDQDPSLFSSCNIQLVKHMGNDGKLSMILIDQSRKLGSMQEPVRFPHIDCWTEGGRYL